MAYARWLDQATEPGFGEFARQALEIRGAAAALGSRWDKAQTCDRASRSSAAHAAGCLRDLYRSRV